MKNLKTLFVALFMSVLAIANAQNNSMLWKISGNGLEKPSYLLGTIHLLCSDELKISETVQELLEETDQLYLELDMDDPEMVANMQKSMMMEEGKTLDGLFTEEEYAALDKFVLDAVGVPVKQVATVKPFFVMSMLYAKVMGCTPASMEMELVGQVKANNKEVYGLETVSDQVSAVDYLSTDNQAEMLIQVVTDLDSQTKEFDKLKTLYKTENYVDLYEASSESMSEYKGFDKVMLDDRNKKWIPLMEDQMKSKSTFFAVGSAHLGGKRGVINLLNKAGYTLTPVKQIYASEEKSATAQTNPLINSWKMDKSHIDEVTDQAINNILESNPGMEEQILSQRSMIARMVENTVKEYHKDGSYKILVPGTTAQTGKWTYDEKQSLLIEVGPDGEETERKVIELTVDKLVIESKDGNVKTFHAIK